MTDADIQARALIAAALIQSKTVEIGSQHLQTDSPMDNVQLQHLRTAVERIFDALMH